MKVIVTSGNYKGAIGHLSYDEDGAEWVVIYNDSAGGWMDLQVPYVNQQLDVILDDLESGE